MSGNNTRPIFKPIRGKYKPLGIPVSKWFIMIAVALVMLFVAWSTGSITHNVSVPYTKAEIATLSSEYINTNTTLASLDKQRQMQGLDSISEMDLTQAQRETIANAREYGITVGMSEDEVYNLVPKEHSVEEPVIPDLIRYFVLLILPISIFLLLFIEVNRTSAYKELKRLVAYHQSQKHYKSKPITYVEQECQTDYLGAVLTTYQKR